MIKPLEGTIEEQLLKLELAALDQWNNGDPSGYLDLSADDVVYFDPFLEQRLTGKTALTAYYEALRGTIKVDRNEFINPLVQVSGNMAVLTFNLNAYVREAVYRWNCTEVYRQEETGWKIIQTHWSFVKP
ncbi:MAG: DUF4440 domain-containing protein [Ignavibacteriales bacterium]|nr:DUF4440 domain-containing protein [Ignavibacteriales bacterium]